MTQVPPVQPSTGLGSTTGQGGIGLNQNAFLQLMVAQLQNQNPLNPVSTTSFLQEMAALTEVVDLQQVLQDQTAATAVGLLGKTVTATNPATGKALTGTVSSVSLNGGSPTVTVGGTVIPLSSVSTVS